MSDRLFTPGTTEHPKTVVESDELKLTLETIPNERMCVTYQLTARCLRSEGLTIKSAKAFANTAIEEFGGEVNITSDTDQAGSFIKVIFDLSSHEDPTEPKKVRFLAGLLGVIVRTQPAYQDGKVRELAGRS